MRVIRAIGGPVVHPNENQRYSKSTAATAAIKELTQCIRCSLTRQIQLQLRIFYYPGPSGKIRLNYFSESLGLTADQARAIRRQSISDLGFVYRIHEFSV